MKGFPPRTIEIKPGHVLSASSHPGKNPLTDAEIKAAVLLALEKGVPEAARQMGTIRGHKVRQATLRTWLKRCGLTKPSLRLECIGRDYYMALGTRLERRLPTCEATYQMMLAWTV